MKKNIFHTTHRKMALATTLLLVVSCIGGGAHLTSCTSPVATAYYIDPVEGNDANSGRSPQEAWKTLEKASTVSLIPGEQLLLKRGATLNGQLEINARGTAAQPVTVGAYGDSQLPKPCIVGDDTSLYAVRVFRVRDRARPRNREYRQATPAPPHRSED